MRSQNIHYVGVNDHILDLFEGQFPIPNGMAYNSYMIVDEKIAVIDSVEASFSEEWLDNIRALLGQRAPDYLIVQHMEPDHSGSILRFTEAFPNAAVVSSERAFTMMINFYGAQFADRRITVGEGSNLSLGRHELHFITAPMVHWPEVIMTYDSTAKVLFSADAFGKFGARDIDEPWIDEARRYYFGIVGKYGGPVQTVLKKAAALDIEMICPLHGPTLQEDVGKYLRLYDTWSSYAPEEDGIVIAYTSVYGNTKKAALELAELLGKQQKVVVYDLARCDMFAAIADAFRYSKLVLATTTYNGSIFPFMEQFIHHLIERGFTKRTVAFIENGSWAPAAKRVMLGMLEKCKGLTFTEAQVTILSAMNETSKSAIAQLAEALCRAPSEMAEEDAPAAVGGKKFVCDICGYVHEAETLDEAFLCPLCKADSSHFKEA